MSDALALVARLSLASSRLSAAVNRSLSATHGLGFNDYLLLDALGGDAVPRRIDLARQVGLSPSGVTRALLPLEKRGLVKRQRDPNDARASRAGLTAAGRALLADARLTAAEAADAAVSRRLSDDDRSLLVDLLGDAL